MLLVHVMAGAVMGAISSHENRRINGQPLGISDIVRFPFLACLNSSRSLAHPVAGSVHHDSQLRKLRHSGLMRRSRRARACLLCHCHCKTQLGR